MSSQFTVYLAAGDAPFKMIATIVVIMLFLGILVRVATVKSKTYQAIAQIPLEDDPVEKRFAESNSQDKDGAEHG